MVQYLGVYHCYAENSIGKGENSIDLTLSMMEYGISEEVMVILIAVAGSLIVLLIILAITACLYCGERKEKKEKGKPLHLLYFHFVL